MKCEICDKKVLTTFLDKIRGTYFMLGKKKRAVCSECQRKFTEKELILQQMK